MRSGTDLKIEKTPLALTFFGLKRIFLFDKIASFVFQHLVPPLRQQICEFEKLRCDTVIFRVVLVRNRKPQKTLFFRFLGLKTQFFCIKLPFSFLVYLVGSIGQQFSCYIAPKMSDTVKLRIACLEFSGRIRRTRFFHNFLEQKVIFCCQTCHFYCLRTFCNQIRGFLVTLSLIRTIQENYGGFQMCNVWKPPKPIFWRFWPKTQFVSFQSRLFPVATPRASNEAGLLWVWLSSKTHKKTAKRFSADIKTQNKTIFWSFLVQKAIFFHTMAFFIVVTPCATNWTAFFWGWASSDTHKKFWSVLVQTLKTARTPLSLTILGLKSFFLTIKLPPFCFNTLCLQLGNDLVSFIVFVVTQ